MTGPKLNTAKIRLAHAENALKLLVQEKIEIHQLLLKYETKVPMSDDMDNIKERIIKILEEYRGY